MLRIGRMLRRYLHIAEEFLGGAEIGQPRA